MIKSGTILISDSGIFFTLQEDIDFTEGGYKVEASEEDGDGTVLSLFLIKEGLCISGITTEEIIDIPDSNQNYFSKVTLDKDDITSIVSVIDENNNEFYEVDYLTQTTLFKKIKNNNENYMTVMPVPRRFIE